MPKIAQKGIDDATLSYTSLKFMKPSLESLTLSVNALQHSDSKFTPTLDAFNVSMHLVTDGITSEKVITQIGMPEIHAHHPDTNIIIEGQKASIVDMGQVTAFAKQVLTQESIEVRMQGKTKLHLGALPVNSVNYNSSISFKGILRAVANYWARANQSSTQWPEGLQHYGPESKLTGRAWRAQLDRDGAYSKPICSDS